ncbi:MAG: SsrA-binding protein SmpB [Bacilli bacterium]|nr:SsrA-binding protein SmpB [Bacilli bacterium]
MEILNRKARHDYFIKEEFECGIALKGTEIKSIREGTCNIQDSYGIIKKNELYILNMFIGEYKEGNIFNHQETRTRKLLMHKKEILKLSNKITLEGFTLIPLKVYFKNNKAKILLGLCKGKKDYDKRESIKERDIKRELEKKMKY